MSASPNHDRLRANRRQNSSLHTNRWFILGILVLARTAVGFQFQSVAAVGPLLIDELSIDYTTLGLVFGLYMLPGIVIAFPGGLLGQRFGDKRVVLVGLSLMTLGGISMGLSEDVTVFAAGRIISGIGAILLNILLAKMVADWFSERDTAVAMAFLLSSWPIGLGLSLVMLAPIADIAGSMLPMLLTAAISAVALFLILAFYRTTSEAESVAGSFCIALSGREWILSILAGFVWAFFNVGFVLVLAFGPVFLVDSGYSLAHAGAIISISMWVSVPALLIGAYLSERILPPDAIMGICFSASAFVIFGLTTGTSPILWCTLLGLLLMPGGLIMKLPVTVLAPKNRAVGMGLFLACFYAAMAAMPPVAGMFRESWESSIAPLWLGVFMYVLAAVFLGIFRVTESWLAKERSAR